MAREERYYGASHHWREPDAPVVAAAGWDRLYMVKDGGAAILSEEGPADFVMVDDEGGIIHVPVPEPGQPLTRPLYTHTRPSPGWRFNSAGLLVEEPDDVARLDYGPDGVLRGILLEPGATNLVPNPRAEGAVVGSPGTMPTNGWSTNFLGRLNIEREVVGFGEEDGIPYLDLRIFRTVADDGGTAIITLTSFLAATGNTPYTWAPHLRLMAGALPHGSLSVRFAERDGGTFLTGAFTHYTPTSDPLKTQRAALSFTSHPDTDNIQLPMWIGYGTSPFDLTLRIGLPHWQVGSFLTSPVMPPIGTPGAFTREADFLSAPYSYSWAEIAAAGGVSFREEGFEGGTVDLADARRFQIGEGLAAGRIFEVRTRNPAGNGIAALFHNGSTGVSMVSTTRPTIGDHYVRTYEVRTQDNAGTPEGRLETMRQWINGVESGSNTTPSGWLDITVNIADNWQGSQTAGINSQPDGGGANRGRGWFRELHTALGIGILGLETPAPGTAVDLLRKALPGHRYTHYRIGGGVRLIPD